MTPAPGPSAPIRGVPARARTAAAPSDATAEAVAGAVTLLRSRPFVALTGAGMSTDSGIPDYRGGSRLRAPVTPMTFAEFRSGAAAQRRYWARAFVGWSRMGEALPNPGHHALAALEAVGSCRGVITQNVDGLHERAGTGRVVALHGRIADVVCLDCGEVSSRALLQQEMAAANPGWLQRHTSAPTRPDGDVALEDTAGFVVPVCHACGGPLKPDVVFFGENVPRRRVARCTALVDEAAALLVLGSSLTVMSGFRFVRYAVSRGIPVVVVNRGPTRGDDLATYKLDHGTTEFLTSPWWTAARW